MQFQVALLIYLTEGLMPLKRILKKGPKYVADKDLFYVARNHGHDKIFIIKIPSNLHTQQQCYAWLTSPLQIFTTCMNIH